MRRLDRSAPVTVIEGLPGSGKTTLAVAWARQRSQSGAHVAWIPGSCAASGTTLLFDLLERDLRSAGLLGAATTPPAGGRHGLPSWVDLLGQIPHEVIVVVDDAHAASPEGAEALCRLIAAAPNLQLLTCSTGEHAFHRAAERCRLDKNVIESAHLAIGADQIPVFAESWGHVLDSERAHALHALVGGWLLPLRLVLDATPTWSRELAIDAADRFARQVIGQVAELADGSVARLAIPELLSAETASILIDEQPASGRVPGEIAALERVGMLWRVPGDRGTVRWRFPILLRRVLASSLQERDPATARRLHRKVAHALLLHGDDSLDGALRHARAGGDWMLLAALWAEHGWAMTSRPAFVDAYREVPTRLIGDHPSLALAAAVARSLSTSTSEGDWASSLDLLFRRYVGAARQTLPVVDVGVTPSEHAELLIAAMVGARSEGNFKLARGLADRAIEAHRRAQLRDDTASRAAQTAWLNLQIGLTDLVCGRNASALERATTAFEVSPDSIVGVGAAGVLAAMHAMAGDAQMSRRWLDAHAPVRPEAHWAAGLAGLPASLARASLALDQLDGSAAEAALGETILGHELTGLWPFVLLVHARYAVLFGDPVAMLSRVTHLGRVLERHVRQDFGVAGEVFDRCMVDLMLAVGEVNRARSTLSADGDSPWLCVPTARFHLMTGDPARAAMVAAGHLWRSDLNSRDRADLSMLHVAALLRQGERLLAAEAFLQAHALCQQGGDLEPYLVLSAPELDEMVDASGVRLAGEGRTRLAHMRRTYPESVALVDLSPREQHILVEMQRHETAAEIARSLSVSVNTVRKQLVSIYSKLGVHDRASALLRARRLGIVDERDARLLR